MTQSDFAERVAGSAMAEAECLYRVLIVDDDDIDRQNYARLLTRQSPKAFAIQHASDGATGLAALLVQKFECVLLDFRLPDMTGLDFLTAAAVEGTMPCAVVLITGQGNEATAVEAMKRGVQDYLIKGAVDQGRLWRAIAGAVTQVDLRNRLSKSLRDLTMANAALREEVLTRQAAECELEKSNAALKCLAGDLERTLGGAERANLAKSRFLAGMSHELRTPLNGILGYAQILRLEGGLNAVQSSRVDAMMGAGTHLLQMIEGVLDLSEIETEHVAFVTTAVDLGQLAAACLDLVRPTAVAKGVALGLSMAAGLPRCFETDPKRLRQVLLNLLGNAVKFTDHGSVELRLQVTEDGTGVRFEVSDTGPGIPQQQRHRLFQEFARLNTAAAKEIEGSGLGLSLSEQLAALMGGRVGHADNPVGGSIFWLELPLVGRDTARPLADTPPAQDVSAVPEAIPAPPPHTLHVLIVDDVDMNRDIAAAFVRAAGHKAVCVESGAEAIAAAETMDFDVVLMDVRMPGMSGLDATRRIRTFEGSRSRVPIVGLTAQVFTEQVAACREAGMDSHLAKPFSLDTLLDAIQHATVAAMARYLAEAVPGDLWRQ